MSGIITVCLVVIAVGGGPFLITWWLDRRRKAIAEVAQQIGWRFTPQPADGHDPRFHGFDVFERGYDRLALNTLQGQLTVETGHGRPLSLSVVAGDFRYKVKTDKGEAIQRFSYLLAALPSGRPGELTIRPEGGLDRWSSAMGFDDIDFESIEFSDRFHVSSSDKRFAYDVLHPRMMEFFLDGDPPHVAVSGDRVCLTEREYLLGAAFESLCHPRKFPEWANWTRRFASLWPRHLQPTAVLS